MAANPLPKKYDLLVAAAEDAADGAAAHEANVGLAHNTEAAIRTDLATLETAQQVFQTARQTSIGLTAAQRSADSNGKAFIASAKNVLEPVLGGQWSTNWVPTGFVTSLATPRKLPARQTLLAALRDYFTANPTHENAPLNVTAAQATTLHTALSDARAAVNAGLVARGQKRAARNAAQRAVRKRLSSLVSELDQLIAGNDPVWLAFGFNLPDADVTPEAPSDVELTLGGEGEVLVDWDDVAGADHYRVFKQEVGVDAGFVAAGSPTDSDFTIEGVTAGNTLRVKVSAVNGSLEGPASDVEEIVVGVALPPFDFNWAQTGPTTVTAWFQMPAGLEGVTNVLFVEGGLQFSTAVSLQPGQSQQVVWEGVTIGDEIDEVLLRDASNEALARGVRNTELADPGV